jgi:hypothetical protein
VVVVVEIEVVVYSDVGGGGGVGGSGGYSATMGRKIKISCCGAPRRRGSCKSVDGIPGEVGRGGLDVK